MVRSKASRDAVVLRALSGERELCAVRRRDVPCEERPVVELTEPGEALRFIDSHGTAYAFDLSPLRNGGARSLWLSVRVVPAFVAQVDGLISADGGDPTAAFRRREAAGVRFQPFYLAECRSDPRELAGRGLFARGLHYPGHVTPSNVSLLCLCDHCEKTFRLGSFHCGFANLVYFYCSGGTHTLTASSDLSDAPPVTGPADPGALARFEQRLPPCQACGGSFRYLNPLRCPHCAVPYIDFTSRPDEHEREYYGNVMFGEHPQHWDPGDPPRV